MMETFSILPFDVMASLVMTHRPSGSDAAARLGNAGDLRGELGRPLREELVQLLDAHPGGLAQRAHAGAGALLRVLVPHERDDLPVLWCQRVAAAFPGDLWRHFLMPLLWIGEEAIVVDGDCGARIDLGRHLNLPVIRRVVIRKTRSWHPPRQEILCLRAASRRPGRARPGRAAARASRTAGMQAFPGGSAGTPAAAAARPGRGTARPAARCRS